MTSLVSGVHPWRWSQDHSARHTWAGNGGLGYFSKGIEGQLLDGGEFAGQEKAAAP